MKALILIKFASLESRDAYYRLCRLEPVVDSFMMYGRYDAALILQGQNLEEVHDIILSQIQPVPGGGRRPRPQTLGDSPTPGKMGAAYVKEEA